MVLCIDTSTNILDIAIKDEIEGSVIDSLTADYGKTHSEVLMPKIDEMLANNNLKIADVTLIIVTIGPGSYTGLRIGMATAQGLARGIKSAACNSVTQPNIHGVSSLTLLARCVAESPQKWLGAKNTEIIPYIDARNGAVFASVCTVAPNSNLSDKIDFTSSPAIRIDFEELKNAHPNAYFADYSKFINTKWNYLNKNDLTDTQIIYAGKQWG
ncbi:MAG: tRNA (adenosine(37)-N6)-threonylcarbamoyltransferase complex dimerization subunit type 1 TsaB [Clostridiales bacterium]|jgi:tRNA threonylcarbamoyl adenosine modification protein YeaZ|nr:tRNA (adenosine(37)-N6)-threonylcarbamoyltransferase complex dimerization subunit type 1 TsaB [Clostridiales bacterium]